MLVGINKNNSKYILFFFVVVSVIFFVVISMGYLSKMSTAPKVGKYNKYSLRQTYVVASSVQRCEPATIPRHGLQASIYYTRVIVFRLSRQYTSYNDQNDNFHIITIDTRLIRDMEITQLLIL